MDESAIIKGCLKDDKFAQEQLYKRFAPKMLGVCYRYAHSLAEAEDFLQEGFIRVFVNLKRFKWEGSLEGWVRRIMVNNALNNLKKNRIRFDPIEENEEAYHDWSISPEIEAHEIMDEIQKLPPGYKVVFNLYAIEGYSHKEIGVMMNIAESTSRSQYTRARAMMIKRLKGNSISMRDE